MDLPRIERKLAAILAADVVGYSRLMGLDEEGTLAQLRAHRRALVDPKINEHRGRIVKTTGDGMLVEFASVVDAVRCAVEVQRGMADRNAGVPQNKRIEFRVGINLGDIIVQDNDIFGDGVNVAARLEGLAEPGGICVSQAARDQLQDKIGVTFEDIGEQVVKNIVRPIHAYRVRFEGVEFARATPETEAPQRNRLAMWTAACVVLLVSVTGAGWYVTRPAIAPGSPRLSIVVLPFANVSRDPEQEYFADGITNDLTTDLSRIPGSFVIAGTTAFTYKGKAVDVKQIGQELGVRYILEGSVQRLGTAVLVNAQLIGAESGAHIWADRFDGDLSNLSELRDVVTFRITRSLSFELPEAENRRSLRERPNNPDAVDYLLRGQAVFQRPATTREEYDEARRLLEAALRIDPGYNEALIWLASADIGQALDLVSDNRAGQISRAEEEIDRALKSAPSNSLAHYVKADVLNAQKRIGEAIAESETAIRLDPNAVRAYARLGLLKWYAGQPEDTFKYVEEAMRRSPKDRAMPIWHFWAGLAHLWLGHLDAAIEELRKAVAGQPGYGLISIYLPCAYGLAGREMEARSAFADTNRLLPDFTIAKWKQNELSDNPTWLVGRERCYGALRKLGMPEQ
jgi:TolB-like protein/class 3 adenylate cyclase/Tfp pilus assembly protein PilF